MKERKKHTDYATIASNVGECFNIRLCLGTNRLRINEIENGGKGCEENIGLHLENEYVARLPKTTEERVGDTKG